MSEGTAVNAPNITIPPECSNYCTVTGDFIGTVKYCPYERMCGKKPCEIGEECPGKKPFVPYIQPYWVPYYPPYYPTYPWGSPIIYSSGTTTKQE